MRVVFAGTPTFAAHALEALLGAGHEVALVVTQPQRPAGRGLRPAPSAVQALAARRGLPVYQPETLKTDAARERIAAARPDLLVVAAYGLIVPPAVLGIPPLGAVNIHASLLPRWRGAAPIQRALLAGDLESGITIMQMDAGLDTGPILMRQSVAIRDDDDAQTLHDRLAALGARLIVSALDALTAGAIRREPQPAEGACYAPKVSKREATLDWSRPAVELERAVRALRPAPVARTLLRGEPLRVWAARVAAGRGEPGTVLAAGAGGLRVACGEGALDVLELQRAGGRRLGIEEFLRGFSLHTGERLGAAR